MVAVDFYLVVLLAIRGRCTVRQYLQCTFTFLAWKLLQYLGNHDLIMSHQRCTCKYL